MKKLLIVVCFVIVLVSAGCSSVSDEESSDIPYSRLSFGILDEDSEYVGTYWIERSNQFTSWSEWGEWTQLEYTVGKLAGGTKVCFGYFPSGNNATFAAKEGYIWGECHSEGRDCLCLLKK